MHSMGLNWCIVVNVNECIPWGSTNVMQLYVNDCKLGGGGGGAGGGGGGKEIVCVTFFYYPAT